MSRRPRPRRVEASPEAAEAAIGETDAFVRTAVRRHNLEASWPLIHPNLKQGLSKKEWLTGDIPVVPFPAKGSSPGNSTGPTPDDVAADVVLQPEAEERPLPQDVHDRVQARRQPRRESLARLLVGAERRLPGLIDDEHAAGVAAALENVRGHQGLSAAWILVPVGIILAVFMLPLVLFLVERRRSRRALAAHQAALAERYGPDA